MPKKIINVFTPSVTRQALKVMKKLSKRPCAKIFVEAFTDNSHYGKNIEPVNLSMITQRLQINDYKSPTEWQRDMKLIVTNCQLIYGVNSNETLLADRLYKVFEKELEFFVCFSVNKWSKLVGILSHNLIFKMSHAMPMDIRMSVETNATLIQGFPFIPNFSIWPQSPIETEPFQYSSRKSVKYDYDDEAALYNETPTNNVSYENNNNNNNNENNIKGKIRISMNKNKTNIAQSNNNSYSNNNDNNDENIKKSARICISARRHTDDNNIMNNDMSTTTNSVSKNSPQSSSPSQSSTSPIPEAIVHRYDRVLVDISSGNSADDEDQTSGNDESSHSGGSTTSTPNIRHNIINSGNINHNHINNNNHNNKIVNNGANNGFKMGARYLTPKETARHEEACFLTAMTSLRSKEDAKKIVEIILGEQPEFDIEEPNPVILFEDLAYDTVKRLIDFTKRRYRELGLQYPT